MGDPLRPVCGIPISAPSRVHRTGLIINMIQEAHEGDSGRVRRDDMRG